MLIGYARVSIDDQDLRRQRGLPKEAGRRIFEEKVPDARRDRPGLARPGRWPVGAGASVREAATLLGCHHATPHRAPRAVGEAA